MIVDDVTISVCGGKGGKGMVAFNRIPMHKGPAGGDGGEGGSVFAEGVSDLGALMQFRHVKRVEAEHGENGKAQFNDGHNGKDAIIAVPVGTVVHDLSLGVASEVTQVGERILIARGGRGGTGNYKFRSSTNTSPYEATDGTKGEEKEIRLELKMIADVGLIGLPNAGKSSLISELTDAKSKVGNYQFTTLEPHLGAYHGLILADIPGLIGGASEGKGLGTKFLRHIERTRVLFHLVSLESDDPLADYHTIRGELEGYGHDLPTKLERVFLTKADEAEPAHIEKTMRAFEEEGIDAQPISILDRASLAPVEMALREVQKEKGAA
jgi:GTP-binding protein